MDQTEYNNGLRISNYRPENQYKILFIYLLSAHGHFDDKLLFIGNFFWTIYQRTRFAPTTSPLMPRVHF